MLLNSHYTFFLRQGGGAKLLWVSELLVSSRFECYANEGLQTEVCVEALFVKSFCLDSLVFNLCIIGKQAAASSEQGPWLTPTATGAQGSCFLWLAFRRTVPGSWARHFGILQLKVCLTFAEISISKRGGWICRSLLKMLLGKERAEGSLSP